MIHNEYMMNEHMLSSNEFEGYDLLIYSMLTPTLNSSSPKNIWISGATVFQTFAEPLFWVCAKKKWQKWVMGHIHCDLMGI
jgi:hypothetical protein